MTTNNNYGIKVRIGAAYDDVTVTNRSTGVQELRANRAAAAAQDRREGKKPWEGSRAKLNDAVVDLWAEDRGLTKHARADKRQRDAAFKKKRRKNREG